MTPYAFDGNMAAQIDLISFNILKPAINPALAFTSNTSIDVAAGAMPLTQNGGHGSCIEFCTWGCLEDTEKVATTLQATNETSMTVSLCYKSECLQAVVHQSLQPP